MPLSEKWRQVTSSDGAFATFVISARSSAVCTVVMTWLGGVLYDTLNSSSRRHDVRTSPRRARTVTRFCIRFAFGMMTVSPLFVAIER